MKRLITLMLLMCGYAHSQAVPVDPNSRRIYSRQEYGQTLGSRLLAAARDTSCPITGCYIDANAEQGSGSILASDMVNIGATGKPLIIELGAVTVSFPSITTTTPTKVTLRFNPGAMLSPASGHKVTIGGAIDAPGNPQIFGGAGRVTLASTFGQKAYTSWWGTRGVVVTAQANPPDLRVGGGSAGPVSGHHYDVCQTYLGWGTSPNTAGETGCGPTVSFVAPAYQAWMLDNPVGPVWTRAVAARIYYKDNDGDGLWHRGTQADAIYHNAWGFADMETCCGAPVGSTLGGPVGNIDNLSTSSAAPPTAGTTTVDRDGFIIDVPTDAPLVFVVGMPAADYVVCNTYVGTDGKETAVACSGAVTVAAGGVINAARPAEESPDGAVHVNWFAGPDAAHLHYHFSTPLHIQRVKIFQYNASGRAPVSPSAGQPASSIGPFQQAYNAIHDACGGTVVHPRIASETAVPVVLHNKNSNGAFCSGINIEAETGGGSAGNAVINYTGTLPSGYSESYITGLVVSNTVKWDDVSILDTNNVIRAGWGGAGPFAGSCFYAQFSHAYFSAWNHSSDIRFGGVGFEISADAASGQFCSHTCSEAVMDDVTLYADSVGVNVGGGQTGDLRWKNVHFQTGSHVGLLPTGGANSANYIDHGTFGANYIFGGEDTEGRVLHGWYRTTDNANACGGGNGGIHIDSFFSSPWMIRNLFYDSGADIEAPTIDVQNLTANTGAVPTGSGTVTTSGTAVGRVTGPSFSTIWAVPQPITINGASYSIDHVVNGDNLVLTASAGTHGGAGVAFSLGDMNAAFIGGTAVLKPRTSFAPGNGWLYGMAFEFRGANAARMFTDLGGFVSGYLKGDLTSSYGVPQWAAQGGAALYNISAGESGTVFNMNQDPSSNRNFALPLPVPGLHYGFIQSVNAKTLTVNATNSTSIIAGASTSIANGVLTSTTSGSFALLEAMNINGAMEWVATNGFGSWNIDGTGVQWYPAGGGGATAYYDFSGGLPATPAGDITRQYTVPDGTESAYNKHLHYVTSTGTTYRLAWQFTGNFSWAPGSLAAGTSANTVVSSAGPALQGMNANDSVEIHWDGNISTCADLIVTARPNSAANTIIVNAYNPKSTTCNFNAGSAVTFYWTVTRP